MAQTPLVVSSVTAPEREEAAVADYRIDDLARAAGTTVRNVRSYQERGLLHPPVKQGRTGVYDETHLARLRLIGRLLDRGYTAAHITEFIANWEAGHDLGKSLGLETALLAPGSGELAEEVSREELVAMFGGVFEPEAFVAAERLGVIAPLADDRYEVRSPRLLRAGAELVGIGMPLMEVLDLGAQLRLRVGAVASLFVASVAPYVVGEHPPGWVPSDEEMPRIISLVEQMRPLARVVVDEELAGTLESGIADYVAQWLAASIAQIEPPSEAS
jgi:DNA-binding transcriptional MerR regulator